MESFRVQLWNRTNRIRSALVHLTEPFLHGLGLTPMQAMVLYAVQNQENANVGSLCTLLECAQGNMSNLCKRLEKDGFLSRRRSLSDERVVLLSLTPKGLDAISRINSGLADADRYFDAQPPQRLQKILDGFDELEQLISSISAAGGKKDNAGA